MTEYRAVSVAFYGSPKLTIEATVIKGQVRDNIRIDNTSRVKHEHITPDTIIPNIRDLDARVKQAVREADGDVLVPIVVGVDEHADVLNLTGAILPSYGHHRYSRWDDNGRHTTMLTIKNAVKKFDGDYDTLRNLFVNSLYSILELGLGHNRLLMASPRKYRDRREYGLVVSDRTETGMWRYELPLNEKLDQGGGILKKI